MSQLDRFDVVMHESMKAVRRFFIPLPDGKSPYLERLILSEAEPDGGKVYLHVIWASDGDRDPHDHPFDFESEILYGSYDEVEYQRFCKPCDTLLAFDTVRCIKCGNEKLEAKTYSKRTYSKGDRNHKEAHQLHRLTVVDGPVVTLVRRGPRKRDWGFQTPEGWVHHKPYIAEKFPGAQPTEVD